MPTEPGASEVEADPQTLESNDSETLPTGAQWAEVMNNQTPERSLSMPDLEDVPRFPSTPFNGSAKKAKKSQKKLGVSLTKGIVPPNITRAVSKKLHSM